MGDVKRSGLTYEQRKARAIERQQAEFEKNKYIEERRPSPRVPTALLLASAFVGPYFYYRR